MGIKVNGKWIDSETVEKLNIIDGEIYVNDCRLDIDGLDNDPVVHLVQLHAVQRHPSVQDHVPAPLLF